MPAAFAFVFPKQEKAVWIEEGMRVLVFPCLLRLAENSVSPMKERFLRILYLRLNENFFVPKSKREENPYLFGGSFFFLKKKRT